MTVKQERAQATRDAVLLAAAGVFDRVGYAGAALSDITAAAGVTKGALYFHFGSKEGLARAIIEQEHRAVMDSASAVLEDVADGMDAAVAVGIDLARRLQLDPVVRAGIRLTTESTLFDPDLTGPYQDWVDTVAAMLRRADAEGLLRPEVDIDGVAMLVTGCFTGIQLVSDVFAGRADLVVRVRALWRVLVPALVTAEALPDAVARMEKRFTAGISAQ